MSDGTPANSLDQMAEEIFALTILAWKDRLTSRKADDAPEMSESQFLAMDTLMHSEGIMTVGEIQRGIGVLPAQMSRIIRSLETSFDKPLIKCELNQLDKRKIDVTMTAEGREVYGGFRGGRLAKSLEILRHLPEKDRMEFVRICQMIKGLYKR